MKKTLILFLMAVSANSFALNYQDTVTPAIKSMFHLVIDNTTPLRKDIPNPQSKGRYVSGDKKLSFASSCFSTVKVAKNVYTRIINILGLSSISDMPHVYGATFPNGIVMMKQIENCTVAIEYVGDPSNGIPEGKNDFINSELNFLTKFDK